MNASKVLSTAPATKKWSRGARAPVTATRNDTCKATFPSTLPRILRPRPQTSTSQITQSARLPREKHRFGASSNPELLRLPRNLQLSASKNAPRPSVFHDFAFQIALAPQRGANLAGLDFQKCSKTHGALTILTFKSLSRHSMVQSSTSKSAPTPAIFYDFDFEIAFARVVQILSASWAADPPQLPFFGADFASPRSHETMEKHNISRNSYPPKSLMSRISAVKHLCCQTSTLQDLAATFNFNVVGKVRFLNFLS